MNGWLQQNLRLASRDTSPLDQVSFLGRTRNNLAIESRLAEARTKGQQSRSCLSAPAGSVIHVIAAGRRSRHGNVRALALSSALTPIRTRCGNELERGTRCARICETLQNLRAYRSQTLTSASRCPSPLASSGLRQLATTYDFSRSSEDCDDDRSLMDLWHRLFQVAAAGWSGLKQPG
jgi:hypothetical protein